MSEHIITVTTSKSVDQVAHDFETAVAQHKYGILHVHPVNETLAKKGVTLEHRCMIYEICNPFIAKQLFDQDMAYSTVLPCRVAIYEDNDKTVKLSTQNPKETLSIFSGQGETGAKVAADLTAILQDAAK